MNGKTYRGASFSELLERAAGELGDAAVVVSSRRLEDDSGLHEIVVRMEGEEQALVPIGEEPKATLLGATRRARQARTASGSAPSLPPLQTKRSGVNDPVAHRLISAGVQPELARRIVAEARVDGQESRDAVRLRLAQILGQGRTASEESRVIVLAGPPGAGKTTLAAKLAAHHRFRLGAQPALVTLDTYRVAAVDQLRTFAELMGLPFAVARGDDELEHLLQVHRRSRPVIVDTPGLLLGKNEDLELLARWLRRGGLAC